VSRGSCGSAVWSHPELGLDAMTSSSSRVVLLFLIEIGPADDEPLVATVWLARRLATGPLKVIAVLALPHSRACRGCGATPARNQRGSCVGSAAPERGLSPCPRT